MKVFLNIPNILTIVRIFAVPFVAYFMLQNNYKIAVFLFIAAEVTDIFDGYIARKTDQVSDFGKLTDPVADKLIHITVLVIFAVQLQISWIFPVVLFLKEILMMTGSIICLKRGIVVSSFWYGKAASLVFFLAIVMVFLGISGYIYIMWIALGFTVFAMIMYARIFTDVLF